MRKCGYNNLNHPTVKKAASDEIIFNFKIFLICLVGSGKTFLFKFLDEKLNLRFGNCVFMMFGCTKQAKSHKLRRLAALLC